jgi:F420H(2)-dependent quinone reductase
VGRYDDLVKRMGHRRWFAAIARRLGPPADRFLFRATGGKLVSTGKQVAPTLLITTIGRKTGQQRTTPLLYLRDGERLVVAGSNWGQPHDPAWAGNLLADPHAWVQIGRQRRSCRARQATPDERGRLWPELDRMWPAYATYRERSGRDVLVFVLELEGRP